jgi:hypothetical protein
MRRAGDDMWAIDAVARAFGMDNSALSCIN